MRGGAATGGDFAHPARMAAMTAAANASVTAPRANCSGSFVVVRGNFAADQFDLLRPRIGFRDWPQYKLVETLRNIFAQSRDYSEPSPLRAPNRPKVTLARSAGRVPAAFDQDAFPDAS